MLYVIVTGGPLPDEAAGLIRKLTASDEDTVVIACDSGTDFLRKHEIVPDMVVGDLDSISPEGIEFIDRNSIFLERYPVEKDWTDTEIALGKVSDGETVIVCPVTGRIDHVIANIGMALRMRSEGRSVKITDGITYCYPLSGEDSAEIDLSVFDGPVAVSLIPWDFGSPVKGVTTKGLYYALEDQDLTAGSTFSFSNRPVDGEDKISVSIRAGILLIVATFAI